MRIVDSDLNTITNYTPEMGSLIPFSAIREDAEPIDDIHKFAWSDDDYEEVMMCIKKEEPKDREPSPQDDTDMMLVDIEYRLTLLELGLNEMEEI